MFVRHNIRENVDVIRLQKQLSEKSAALRVSQEKFTELQEVRQIIIRYDQGTYSQLFTAVYDAFYFFPSRHMKDS